MEKWNFPERSGTSGTNGTKWNLEQMERDGTFKIKWNDTERMEQNGILEFLEQMERGNKLPSLSICLEHFSHNPLSPNKEGL